MTTNTCYIGLGSNLGDPVENLRVAIDRLQNLEQTELVCHSGFYQSPPWGRTYQPDFVNAVAALDTHLKAGDFLERLLALENAMGRQRNDDKWGPRIIDLDVLIFGDELHSSDMLTVPHPLMHERAFVLVPLIDIAPDCEIPGKGRADFFLQQLGPEVIGSVVPIQANAEAFTKEKAP